MIIPYWGWRGAQSTISLLLLCLLLFNTASATDVNDSQIGPGGQVNASTFEFRTVIEFYSGDVQSEDYNWSLTFLRDGRNYTINSTIVPALMINGTNFTFIRQGQVGQFWFYVEAQTNENLSFLFVEHNMTLDGSAANITIPLQGPVQNASVNLTMLVGNITSFYVKTYFNDTSQVMKVSNKATYSLWQAILDELSNIGFAIILLPLLFGFILVILSYGLGDKQHFTLKAALIFFAVVTILPTLWIGNVVVVFYNPSFADYTNALGTLTMICGFICLAYVSYLLITTFIEILKYNNQHRNSSREEKYR